MRRPPGRTLALWLGYLLVVLVVTEAVVRATGWDRLWVLVVVVPVAWVLRGVAENRLDRRGAR
ncbi:hypothetical protein DMO24_10510 [Modestobacter versicolor]|uniref:Uncharacterized protein n=1 Tax=Modestobacter versicolor TaxID=429133 RepID=A0A323V976_9ACTN|nr:hypothetical protein DMO24_10510 [Modestobacter versicolor]